MCLICGYRLSGAFPEPATGCNGDPVLEVAIEETVFLLDRPRRGITERVVLVNLFVRQAPDDLVDMFLVSDYPVSQARDVGQTIGHTGHIYESIFETCLARNVSVAGAGERVSIVPELSDCDELSSLLTFRDASIVRLISPEVERSGPCCIVHLSLAVKPRPALPWVARIELVQQVASSSRSEAARVVELAPANLVEALLSRIRNEECNQQLAPAEAGRLRRILRANTVVLGGSRHRVPYTLAYVLPETFAPKSPGETGFRMLYRASTCAREVPGFMQAYCRRHQSVTVFYKHLPDLAYSFGFGR